MGVSKIVSVTVVVVLLVAGCSGEDEPTATVDPTATVGDEFRSDESVEVAVAALTEDYGNDGAFAVGMFALERGYDAGQVIAGATVHHIQKDGTIDGVNPDGEPLGLIIIDPNNVLFASLRAQPDEPISADEFLDRTKSWEELSPRATRGNELLKLILDRLHSGVCGERTVDGRTTEVGCSPIVLITAIYLGIRTADAIDLLAGADDDRPAEQPVTGADESGGPEDVVTLAGTGTLTTTDVGQTQTCVAVIEVQARIFRDSETSPNQRVEIAYVRTVAAGIPPGGIGEGDTSQYIECIDADRSERHEGSFDVAEGVVQFPEVGEVAVEVSDDGQATLTGTISGSDFLNNWTLDVSLTG